MNLYIVNNVYSSLPRKMRKRARIFRSDVLHMTFDEDKAKFPSIRKGDVLISTCKNGEKIFHVYLTHFYHALEIDLDFFDGIFLKISLKIDSDLVNRIKNSKVQNNFGFPCAPFRYKKYKYFLILKSDQIPDEISYVTKYIEFPFKRYRLLMLNP